MPAEFEKLHERAASRTWKAEAMKGALIFVGVALLSGCVGIYNVVPVGWNRYQAEVSWGGRVGPEREAKIAATKKCASIGETLAYLTIETRPDDPAGHATISFECRAADPSR